ncbi:MAG: SBBP repeat-containing protein, partial [Verrucomicrobiota bacterium]
MNSPRKMTFRRIAIVLAVLASSFAARADLPFSLSYSTYLGGSSWEHARDIYTDAAGFTYVVGGTGSGDFAGASSFSGTNIYNAGQPNGAADGSFGGCDVFITKMSPSGQVLWTKYMGGPNYDRAYALEVDRAGNIYIAGRAGRGFPMVTAMQSTFSGTSSPSNYGDQNGFVAKLNSAGTVLWSTYVGTGELCRDIAIDAAGDVYVPLALAAMSSRTAFNTPALSAFSGKFTNSPPTTNTTDVGVVKLHGDGSGVAWARWIGGTGADRTNPSIRVNAAGEAHLHFATTSTGSSLPAVGAVSQTNNGGGEDSYLAKVAADGTSLIYGTYLGGSGGEAHETHSLALDAAGN